MISHHIQFFYTFLSFVYSETLVILHFIKECSILVSQIFFSAGGPLSKSFDVGSFLIIKDGEKIKLSDINKEVTVNGN